MKNGIFHLVAGTAIAIALSASSAYAQKKYDTGATDTEIKIGQTVPFSGPASAYAGIGKTQAAYLKMINDQGGINGRKLNLIQYDDAYSPPKAVEQVRKLVEGDEVLFTFQIIGTPSNAAVQKYLNAKKVPQLLAATGATRFSDPQNAPWTIAFNPNYQSEGRIYAKYILNNYPNAKIGILYQNDDLGRDYITGLKAGLGDKAATMIVGEVSYELTDPTIDSQIVKLKSLAPTCSTTLRHRNSQHRRSRRSPTSRGSRSISSTSMRARCRPRSSRQASISRRTSSARITAKTRATRSGRTTPV
jgi:ABC-type branched-subunit amino acid transport system substrate-binding protein